MEKRIYETTYIVTPDLSQADYTAIVKKFNKILADNGGKVMNQEVWGLRKMAYPIKKKQSGYYVYTEFETNLEVDTIISKLETEYTYDERVIRYLTVKLDKYAAEWNVKRKSKVAGSQTAK